MLHFGWDLVQWIWLKCWPLWLYNTLHLHTHIYTLAFSFFSNLEFDRSASKLSHMNICAPIMRHLIWSLAYFDISQSFSFTLAFRYLCKLMCTLWWMQLHTQKKSGEFTTGSHLGVSWTVNVFFFHIYSPICCRFTPSHSTREQDRRRCRVSPETPETAGHWWWTSRPLSGLSLLRSPHQSTDTGTPEHRKHGRDKVSIRIQARTQTFTHSPPLPSPSSGLGRAGRCSPTCLRPRWMCWWPSWFWRPLCTAGTSGESCKGCPGGSSCPELCQSAGWLLHRNCHKI